MISIRVSTSPSTDIAPDDSLTASLAPHSWSNELTDEEEDVSGDKGDDAEHDDETEEGDENGWFGCRK